MPRPNNPNTRSATASTVKRGHDTMADKLRALGYTVVAPQDPPCGCYQPYIASGGAHYCKQEVR